VEICVTLGLLLLQILASLIYLFNVLWMSFYPSLNNLSWIHESSLHVDCWMTRVRDLHKVI
jgi:hypothetical protein